MTAAIQTVQLNDYHKTTVLAKKDAQYGLVARVYKTYNKAYYALEVLRSKGIEAGIDGHGNASGWYIVIIEA